MALMTSSSVTSSSVVRKLVSRRSMRMAVPRSAFPRKAVISERRSVSLRGRKSMIVSPFLARNRTEPKTDLVAGGKLGQKQVKPLIDPDFADVGGERFAVVDQIVPNLFPFQQN